ncbi:GAF domain-containing protein [Mesorhizobium sp. RP14(2022)]|uniref:histidine kinase n=1 Tax=Mesorhizobium liriopis TaxID=2953882 RepID=A0ABT1CBY9_9HYPH|nr:GAF domain-containing protein [Mesorhizobium liriopis]MCO6052334.1 GAF domain-containing protein [Mesorhizobium liriopis]
MKSTEVQEQARLRALRASGLLRTTEHRHFQNQIALVRQSLGVPVAVISILEEDRQVFAAHEGLPFPWSEQGETPLTHSFCKHVVTKKAPLVVPDALNDPLVSENLAIRDLDVRAYLGAPLVLPSGEVIGAVAAICGEPRQWTDAERDLLVYIARVVSDEIETRISELKWRTVFTDMQEGLILGEVIRDDTGRVVDWRYSDVNAAWGKLVGLSSDDVIGRTILEVFPGIESEWITDFAFAVDTGETVFVSREVSGLQKWFEGFIRPTGTDTFTLLFTEITDRIKAKQRQDALVRVGDRLREISDMGEAAYVSAEAMAKVLGATRSGFGIIDLASESVEIQPDWCAPGTKSIAGHYQFRDFGSFIDNLKRGETVIIPNVADDPRTAGSAEAFAGMGIVDLVNVPIMERGRLVGIMFVHNQEARPLAPEEVLFVKAIGDRTHAALARYRAEADQQTINREISHRLKNTLSLVQAISSQTLRSIEDRKPVEAFESRVHALSTAHDIMFAQKHKSASLKEVARGSLAAIGQTDRITITGPAVELSPRSALSVALIIHELGTNAMKYGALSNDDGHVTIAWETNGDDLALHWREHGGPSVSEPTRKGFGSKLIQMGLIGSGGVSKRYPETGFEADMAASIIQLEAP